MEWNMEFKSRNKKINQFNVKEIINFIIIYNYH